MKAPKRTDDKDTLIQAWQVYADYLLLQNAEDPFALYIRHLLTKGYCAMCIDVMNKDWLEFGRQFEKIAPNDAIEAVYQKLKSRGIHPTGIFNEQGRWRAANGDLIYVRTPSVRYPYSEMNACRTKKYVLKVAAKYGCITEQELLFAV